MMKGSYEMEDMNGVRFDEAAGQFRAEWGGRALGARHSADAAALGEPDVDERHEDVERVAERRAGRGPPGHEPTPAVGGNRRRTGAPPVPRGVVGIIAPWNYPVGNFMKSLLPALLSGNAVIMKPSEHTPRAGAWLAELAR